MPDVLRVAFNLVLKRIDDGPDLQPRVILQKMNNCFGGTQAIRTVRHLLPGIILIGYNCQIPSRYGEWEPGVVTKNIPTGHIIEDPVFKASQRSYFLQLTDCVAYSLLRKESPPSQFTETYGIREMFQQALRSVCFLAAARDDPEGIVRK